MKVPGLYEIRSPWVRSFLLVEEAAGDRTGVVIDTGIIGHTGRLERLLGELDMAWTDIRAILLTHGHLDHIGNLAAWKQRTGAPMYGHPGDAARFAGCGTNTGWARIGATLESIGRDVLELEPFVPDAPLADGLTLPFWGGLEVVHFPGHTAGHCGFWSPRTGILFSADLAAAEYGFVFPAPAIFTDDPAQHRASLRRAQQLPARLVLTNHIRGTSDENFTQVFQTL